MSPIKSRICHSGNLSITKILNVGSIYNDIDHNPLTLLQNGENFSFKSTQESNVADVRSSEIIQGELDYAVLKADEIEGIANEDIVFQNEYWDIENQPDDEEYLKKVFLIASNDENAWKNQEPLSKQAEKIYLIRY